MTYENIYSSLVIADFQLINKLNITHNEYYPEILLVFFSLNFGECGLCLPLLP